MRTHFFNFSANRIKAGFVVAVIAIWTLSSCSGGSQGGSSKENKYLGKIPAQALILEEEIYKLMEEQNRVSGPEEYRKIEGKIKELDRKNKAWMEEYASAGGVKPTIPFEVQGELPYTVKEVGLRVSGSVVKLSFKLVVNKAIKGTGFLKDRITLYFTGVNSDDEILILSLMPARYYEVKKDMLEGSEFVMEGTWNRQRLVFLEDLDKILI
ncbi:MAG: hypothetical protein U1D64_01875, partial [Bacteroidales bacterium]|nr:hypothetical protein [Bacteroidales bacterium]